MGGVKTRFRYKQVGLVPVQEGGASVNLTGREVGWKGAHGTRRTVWSCREGDGRSRGRAHVCVCD